MGKGAGVFWEKYKTRVREKGSCRVHKPLISMKREGPEQEHSPGQATSRQETHLCYSALLTRPLGQQTGVCAVWERTTEQQVLRFWGLLFIGVPFTWIFAAWGNCSPSVGEGSPWPYEQLDDGNFSLTE